MSAAATPTAAMPASPITTAVTRAAWPEIVGRPSAGAADRLGATAAVAPSNKNPASQPRSSAPPERKPPRSASPA